MVCLRLRVCPAWAASSDGSEFAVHHPVYNGMYGGGDWGNGRVCDGNREEISGQIVSGGRGNGILDLYGDRKYDDASSDDRHGLLVCQASAKDYQ